MIVACRRPGGVGSHHVKAEVVQPAVEVGGVVEHPGEQRRSLVGGQIRTAASAAPTAAGTAGGGEEERPRGDPQVLDDLGRPGDEPAAGGQRLRERAHAQVDPVLDAEQLARPGAARAEHADAVGLVDHQPRAVALRTARRSRAAARRRPPSRRRRRRRRARRRRRRRRAPASRSSLSRRLWRKGRSLARERMQPSRIEAWSPESATTVSPGSSSVPSAAEVGLVAGGEDDRVLGAHARRRARARARGAGRSCR